MNAPGSGSTPETWLFLTDKPGYAFVGAMENLPDDGGTSPNPSNLGQAPRLDFRVRFVKTGTHYIWIRGSTGPNGGNADSLHAGLDGTHVGAFSGINNTGFVWSTNVQTTGTPPAPIGANLFEIFAPGEYTLNVWMREDGAWLDRLAALGFNVVEYQDDLAAPAWNALPGVAGTGGTVTVTDPTSLPTPLTKARLYRVRVQ